MKFEHKPPDNFGYGVEKITLFIAMIAAVPVPVIWFHPVATMPGTVIKATSAITAITYDPGWENGDVIEWHKHSVSVADHVTSRAC